MFSHTLEFGINPKNYAKGLCVLPKHEIIVLPNRKVGELHVYSLLDGSLIREIGELGHGRGQLNFGCGGMCVAPDGDSVLLADFFNDRVTQIRVLDGVWLRCMGDGVLTCPNYVDCNTDVVAVSHSALFRICVLSWPDGNLLAQFGSSSELRDPGAVRILHDGSGLVVADYPNHRLCVFSLRGEVLATVGNERKGLNAPHDFIEYTTDDSFIVANWRNDKLVKLSKNGGKAKSIVWNEGAFTEPVALAAFPNGGIVIRSNTPGRITVLHLLELRFVWIRVCATLVKDAVGPPTTKRRR